MTESTEAAASSDPPGGEREIAELVELFLAGFDLKTDIDRFRAFRDAIAYAQEHLLNHSYCNLFLERVGRAVGREPAFLDNLKFRVELPESARLDFCYED